VRVCGGRGGVLSLVEVLRGGALSERARKEARTRRVRPQEEQARGRPARSGAGAGAAHRRKRGDFVEPKKGVALSTCPRAVYRPASPPRASRWAGARAWRTRRDHAVARRPGCRLLSARGRHPAPKGFPPRRRPAFLQAPGSLPPPGVA
jgi:hypothetical protein